MSTSGPDDTPPPSELQGLDPKDLLQAGLETVPPVTLPPQPVDSDATIAVARPQSTQPTAQVELPLPEELTNLLPHGNYHVESFLGQGGMGAVYKASQVRLKRPVAIKIMRRDMGKDYDFEARFEREAQAMAKLNHPNIVSVIDFGEAGADYLYIVMELIDGADLMDVIRGGQMTQEMALSLLPQVCDALQFAHDHGIVHRDIKPSNIMLTRDGRVKMCDFGLAKRYDVESSFRTQTGTGMGTPDYAAPEQFDPKANIDHRADIYALGVMIYQMITGQLPRGVWKPPSQRAAVQPEWDDIVSRAMQSDPSDRYQQASEVKTDVSSIALVGRSTDIPVRAPSNPPPSGASQGTDKKVRSTSRAPLLFGLTIGAVVIAAGAFFARKKPQQSGPLSPLSGTINAKAPTTPSPEVTSPKPAAAESPTPSLIVSKPSITVQPLPESGWKPLFSEAEWKKEHHSSRELNGRTLEMSREFKDGLLHVRNSSFKSLQPSPDWAIRSRIVIQEGTREVGIQARTSIIDGNYRLVTSANLKSIHLEYWETGKPTPVKTLGKCELSAQLRPGDKLLLELRIQGNHLTGVVNGVAFIDAYDERVNTGGEWGVCATDGWLESVEVQPLPAASPEQWQDMLRDPKKLSLAPLVAWTPEGLRFTGIAGASLGTGQGPQRDGAVRMRTAFGAVRPRLTARQNKAGDKYMLSAADATRVTLYCWDQAAKKSALKREFPLRVPLQPGQDYELELRVVGQTFTAKCNGETLGTVNDGTIAEGAFGVLVGDGGGAPVLVKSLEFLDLTAPAKVSPSPNLPVSKSSDPKFPSGQWVKLFTKAEELPADLGKPDSGVKFEDGWIRVAPSAKPLVLPDELSGNYGIRLRAIRAEIRTDMALRWQKSGNVADKGLYSIQINSNELLFQRLEQDKYFSMHSSRLAQPPAKGTEYAFEYGVVGDRVVGRVGTNPAIMVRDARWVRGPGYLSATEDLRDIEVINLDGLPEAEALRLLGVDEQGNDLRGKAGAVSPSPSLPFSKSSAATATKDAPFINTLGMKFVPVPIGGGPTKGQSVLFGVWDVRVQDYAAYAAENPKVDGSWKTQQKQGVPVGCEPDHPVVGVNWVEAQAFCQWITAKETAEGKLPQGMKYRLPSDEEWSWAAGLPSELGATPAEKDGKNTADFPWGKDWLNTKKVGNYADEAFHAKFPKDSIDKERVQPWIKDYNDGYVVTSPVGSFSANAYGLYDMGGNVWQWCEDWYDDNQSERVLRGASWAYNDRKHLLSSCRSHFAPMTRNNSVNGFRCVLVPSPPASSAVSPSPNLPVSKPSDPKFPPGQWVKLFTKPEDLPADLRKPDSGVTLENGWIRGGPPERKLILPASLKANYGLRATFKRSTGSFARLCLRHDFKGEQPYYQIGIGSSDKLIMQATSAGNQRQGVWTIDIPKIADGSDYRLEFAAVGNLSVARYGDIIKTMDIKDAPQGGAQITGLEDIRDIEVINLDGLSEAEALRLLGVDEKGNDLRGKTGASTGSTVTTPTPGWLNALAEAPLKKVIATADHTDKGYLLPPGNHWEFPAQPLRAGAIRVLAVTEVGSPNHLSLNFGLPGTRDHYQVFFRRKLNECGLGYLKEGLPERRLALKKGVHVADGQPHELLLARIADQFYFLLNGEVILQAAEPDATARYLTLNCFGDTRARVQKVEYLNLDGLPEAEALQLLGVDEKGNDLRGKAGASAEPWLDALKDPTFTQSNGNCVIGPDGFRSRIDYIWHLREGTMTDGAIRMVTTYEGLVGPRLVARADTGSKNHYQVNIEPGGASISLVRKADTTYIKVANAPVTPAIRTGDLVDLELRAVGPKLTVKLNGTAIVQATDTTHPTGKFGIWALAKTQSPVRSLQFLPLTDSASLSPSLPVSLRGSAASSPSSATKEAPFINTLGMKFVPVPGTKALFCIHETRCRDYQTYAAETKVAGDAWKDQTADGFTPTTNTAEHPVMNVSWQEAKGFCEWLSKKEGVTYRLPTDEEWSLAVGLAPADNQPTGTTPDVLSGRDKSSFP